MFLLLSLLACGSPQGATSSSSRSDMTIQQFEKALDDKPLVFDVRTPDEWKTGHVPGAVLHTLPVPPDHPALQKHDKSKPVYLICESGGRSGRAADALASAGYTTVNVLGGTGAWRQAGKPLTKP